MTLYLWLNVLIILFPLLLSFDRRVAFYRSWPSVLPAIAVVGILYIAWDVYMSANGHWGFNPRYSGRVRILHLPLGELLFFLTAPYSCLFIYEVVRAYFKEAHVRVPRALWLAVAGALATAAVVFRSQVYTFSVLLSVALFLSLAALLRRDILGSRHFWLFMALSYIPFLLFNGLLTGIPLVVYSSEAIWGARLYTIPVEDTLYSFSLLGFGALVHRMIADRRGAGRRKSGHRSIQRRPAGRVISGEGADG